MADKVGSRRARAGQVIEALERFEKGESVTDIARALGFTHGAVSRWISGRTHARVAPSLRKAKTPGSES